MSVLLNIIIFIIALSFLIMIHEFGHLVFAKMFGVFCYEYSIGMGPRIFSKKIGETYYSIKLFPIGGSVIMAGEEIDEETIKNLGPIFDVKVPIERTLHKISNWKKLFVVGGGAFFNLIIGYFLILLVVLVQGIGYDTNRIVVNENSIIETVGGLKTGDQIVALDIEVKGSDGVVKCYISPTEAIKSNAELHDKLQSCSPSEAKDTQTAYFYYLRDESNGISNLITRSCGPNNCDDLPLFGFTNEIVFRNAKASEIITVPFNTFGDYSIAIFKGLATLFTPSGFNNVSGPVGIFKVSSQVAESGLFIYFSFMALLSINLGIFNLIPFPGLDGATIFITSGEMITKKELSSRTKAYINYFGFFFLIALIIIVTIKDIINI